MPLLVVGFSTTCTYLRPSFVDCEVHVDALVSAALMSSGALMMALAGVMTSWVMYLCLKNMLSEMHVA